VPDYSIWTIQYASAVGHPVGSMLYGHHNAGVLAIPYCYHVVQGADDLLVIDTGYSDDPHSQELGKLAGVVSWADPATCFGRIGLRPEDVDVVVITHAHFDHMGNLAAFPNAHVYLQERELAKALSAFSLPHRLAWMTAAMNADDLDAVVRLVLAGRVTLLDGRLEDLLPGISLVPAFDSHTQGSQYVVVENGDDGRWVVPGDVIGMRANLRGVDGDGRYVPIGFASGSQRKVLAVMDDIMQAVGGDVTRVLAPHDPELWSEPRARRFDDDLYIAEMTLREGAVSRL